MKTDGWLAGILGTEAFRFDVPADGDLAGLRAHLKNRTGFYYAKVDTAAVSLTRALAAVGFFVADVNVTLSVRPGQVTAPPAPAIEVGALREGEAEVVLAIAHDSFKYTRFHLDPLISNETANAVKREWVRNYADRKRGDHLFVATMGGKPVGFLAALASADHVSERRAVIDLIGVAPTTQRQGAGRAMIAQFAHHYSDATELIVGTQVANVPSVRLYESMGFRMKSSQYVMHLHVRDGNVL